MYFGWGVAALLLMGLITPKERSAGRVLAGVGLVLVLLSIWPFSRVLDGLPIFGRIMFPWRLFAPATALAALSGGLAFRGRALGVLVLLILLAVDATPFLGAAQRYPAAPASGFFVFGPNGATPAEAPRDRFVRIEGAPLPPSDYGGQLAKSRWVFSEYMAVPLRERYGKLSRPPSKAESGYFGAELRFNRSGATRTPLPAQPIAQFRESGGEWRGLPNSSWDLLPERITLRLPEGANASELRFKGAWFPGWEVRVDGGQWSATSPSEEHLLQVGLPPGAARVEFRYGFWSEWPRPLGLALSIGTLLGLGLGVFRGRRQTVQEDG